MTELNTSSLEDSLSYLSDKESETSQSKQSVVSVNSSSIVKDVEDYDNDSDIMNLKIGSEIESTNEDNDILNPEIESTNEDNDILNSEIESANNDNDLLHLEIESTNNNNDLLNPEIESTNNDNDLLNPEIESANNDNDILHLELESTNNDNDLLNPEIESTNNDNDLLHLEIESTNNDIDLLNPEIESTNNDNDLLNPEIESANNDNDLLHLEIESTNNDNLLNPEIESTNNDNDLLNPEIESTNNDNDLLNPEIESANNNNDLLYPETESANNDNLLHPEIESADNDNDLLHPEIESANNDNDLLHPEIESANNDNDILHLELESTNNDNDILHLEIESANNDNDLLHPEIESANNDNDLLHPEIESANKDNDLLHPEIESANNDNDILHPFILKENEEQHIKDISDDKNESEKVVKVHSDGDSNNSKNKNKSNTKPGSKCKKNGKKIKNSIIDDKVLNEVKCLMKAKESKCENDELAESVELSSEKVEHQARKLKEKKKKKTKRSSSKNCENSNGDDVTLSKEGASWDKRIILKRGTIWRNMKCEDFSNSPDISENKENLSNSMTLETFIPCESNATLEIENAKDIKLNETNVPRLSGDDLNVSEVENIDNLKDLSEYPKDITNESEYVKNNISSLPEIGNKNIKDDSTYVDMPIRIVIPSKHVEDNNSTSCFESSVHLEFNNGKNNDKKYDSKNLVSVIEISNDNNCSSDVEKEYSFDTKVTVVVPSHPHVEYLSCSSSLSTRSNSLERVIDKENAENVSQDSLNDVIVPVLFDDVEFSSKLDGIKNLKFRNKKRHSLPKVKLQQRTILKNISSNCYSNSCIDIKSSYENVGDILYDENCQCSENEKLNFSKVQQKSNVSFSKVSCTDTEEKDSISETDKDFVDDSDERDGTWHHKNIKEKIRKIIGVRLQHNADPRIQTDSALNQCSSEIASLSLQDKTTECSKLKTFNFDNQDEIPDNVNNSQEIAYSDNTMLIENSVDGRKFISKNLRHMNLTFLTDSEEKDLMSSSESVDGSSSPKGTMDRWGNVQTKALERQQQSAQFRHLQRQLKTHRLNIESVLSRCSGLTLSTAVDNFSQISNKLEEMKGLLNETETMRSDLSGLNVIVHRFISEMGPSFTLLKDEMAELYRLWDETHRRVNGELSNLQNISAACRLWEEQKSDLSKALKQDSETLKVIDAAIDSGKLTETVSASVRDVAKLLNEKRKLPNTNKTKFQVLSGEKSSELSVIGNTKREDRLSDSGTSGYESCSSDDLSERERRLAYLRRLARDLQSSLMPGSIAWNEVNATLDEAEKELKGLQDHCRMLILKTTETLEPSSKPLRFSSNCKRKNWIREKGCRNARVERRSRVVGGNRRGGDWVLRVARAAVPFQVALMLLLCVAYLLEPNCCDSVNTFNLSFTPQLRYVHGSPPV